MLCIHLEDFDRMLRERAPKVEPTVLLKKMKEKGYLKTKNDKSPRYGVRLKEANAQFASTDCPFRMSGAGSSVEAVWV